MFAENKAEDFVMTVSMRGIGVSGTVLGAIKTTGSRSQLVFANGTPPLTAQRYVDEILQPQLLSLIAGFRSTARFISQQDNARLHCACLTHFFSILE